MQKQKKQPRLKSAKGEQYKIRNWASYNQALKQRGSLEIWIEKGIEDKWYYEGDKQRGGQFKYSNTCIELACTLREIYKLPYRQTEGFISSLASRLGWNVIVPDYTVINRRRKNLPIELKGKCKVNGEKKYILIDSTGLKVYGEGEWKVRQHGYGKHRTWMKVHVSVDEATTIIEGCITTTNSVDDAAVVAPLLDQVDGQIAKMAGDGAYDKTKVYKQLAKRKIKPIIPPQKRARIKKHGNLRGRPLPRDQNIRAVRKLGKKQWKQKVHYHRRSIVENIMYRFKTIFGGKLSSRTFQQQQVEVYIKCKLLNKMTELGRPDSYKVKKVS